MAKRLKLEKPDSNVTQAVVDSARQIWLAGLGALARGQEEGMKLFDTLVKTGSEIESRGRDIAGAGLTEIKDRTGGIANKAMGTWNKLEGVLEDRMTTTFNRLGVVTHRDIQELSVRVAELSRSVDTLVKGGKAPAARATAKRPIARKAVRKAAARHAA